MLAWLLRIDKGINTEFSAAQKEEARKKQQKIKRLGADASIQHNEVDHKHGNDEGNGTKSGEKAQHKKEAAQNFC